MSASPGATAARSRVYDAPFRDPAGRQRKKTFPKRVEADRFAASVETDKTRGAYTDASREKLPVEQWAESGDVSRSGVADRRS
jgi:hypothetical protein